MSEGADSIAHSCENSLNSTLKQDTTNPEDLPPRVITHTGRRPRFGTGNAPLSPYILIDGKKLRSALALRKKWPPRRVSFPTNDSHLVTGYLEPANPWKLAENVNREDLISAYKESCIRHSTNPLESVIGQLEKLDICEDERSEQLNLKGEVLDQKHSEPLEEILKRVQFNKVNLEGTSLDDESSVILFDMLEYYESARQLNISANQEIGIRGWQACAHMIKKTQCLEQLEAKDVTLNEQYMNTLSRALRLVCHLHVLKLENCGLSGRAIVILVTALKMNTGIRELYLADNGLDLYDAIQLGSLLRINNHLQLLDISNNNIQDDGVRDILEGLINQVNEDKDGKGLSILILWNNRLTKKSSPYFSRIITFSKTLETLNIGQNALTDELLSTVKDALKKNDILLQLGMQSTELTCEGIITLSEIIQTNQTLERIDLRDNSIQMAGMKALSAALKKNKNITQIDLDDKPRIKIDGSLHQYMEILAEIRASCSQNEKTRSTAGTNEGSESPVHHSRFCNASSRKISLTCQTLPCSSPPTAAPPMPHDPATANRSSMLEPKPRASGGRLRSPAPSPIPSPVASPIPSPSRSRFVVSRVPEPTLRSTDSSASSSPVTPPSLGSSPSTCFFPSAASPASSRFRVSVVAASGESVASGASATKSVVTSAKGNVTFGFNFKLDTVESTDSDDSDSVFRAELGAASNGGTGVVGTSCPTSGLVPCVERSGVTVPGCGAITDAAVINTNDDMDCVKIRAQDSVCFNESIDEDVECDARDNQIGVPSEQSEGRTPGVGINRNESTKDIQTRVNRNEDNTESNCPVVTSKLTSADYVRDPTKEPATAVPSNEETAESQPQGKQNSTVQKHTSNLEKLLALFQNPGSLFSDSGSINQIETKSTFQDSVNSVMAFGDKFHHYLKEGKEKVNIHGTCPWTSDDTSKSKPAKSANITQLSSFQTLTNMFSSFKLDTNLNLFEQSSAKSGPKPSESGSLEKESGKAAGTGSQEVQCTIVRNNENRKFNIYIKEKEEGEEREEADERMKVSASNNQSLPDDVQSKANEGHANKDLVLEENRVVSTVEACSKIVNTSPMTNVPESKATVCIPKLVNIPEYSVLELEESNVTKQQGEEEEVIDKVGSMLVEIMCDRTSTDSINLTSDSNAPSCNITCDIKLLNDVHNVDTVDTRSHNLISINLNTEDGVTDGSALNNSNEKRNNARMSFVPEENLNVNNNNVTPVQYDQPKLLRGNDNSNNEVTNTTRSTDNNDKEDPTNLHNIDENLVENTDNTCHVDNLPYLNSTIVNRTSEKCIANVIVTSKDNIEFNEGNSRGCSSVPGERSTDASQPEEPVLNLTKTIDHEKLQKTVTEALNQTRDDSFLDNTQKIIDNGLIPTVILSYHETTEEPGSENQSEKSDTDDLIFCMTDISTEVPVEEDLRTVQGSWPCESSPKTSTMLYDLPQTSRSALIIEKPESPHRNSQDSGIEEANLSTIEDTIPDASHSQPRESFQESVDSGIDSECSSVYARTEPGPDGARILVRKSTSDSGADSVSETATVQEDLFEPRILQCAVLASACSIPGVDATTDDDDDAKQDCPAVVPDPSQTAVHASSTK